MHILIQTIKFTKLWMHFSILNLDVVSIS